MDRGILSLHQMEERGLLLPLPDAKLQEVQRHQPPVTPLPIRAEPQIAQGLDQGAGQEQRKGQPPPEEVTCGEVVNNGAETWGERRYEGVGVEGTELGDRFLNTRSLLLQCLSSKPSCHRQQRSSRNAPRIRMLAS